MIGNSAGQGGAIYTYAGNPSLINCSLTGNSASNGGGAFFNSNSTLSLSNCIVFDNGSGNTIGNTSSTVVATYSLFGSLVTGYTDAGGNLTSLTSSPFVASNSVVLNSCSPAINAGNPASTTVISGPYSATALPATDQLNNPRIVGGRVDMVPSSIRQPPTFH